MLKKTTRRMIATSRARKNVLFKTTRKEQANAYRNLRKKGAKVRARLHALGVYATPFNY